MGAWQNESCLKCHVENVFTIWKVFFRSPRGSVVHLAALMEINCRCNLLLQLGRDELVFYTVATFWLFIWHYIPFELIEIWGVVQPPLYGINTTLQFWQITCLKAVRTCETKLKQNCFLSVIISRVRTAWRWILRGVQGRRSIWDRGGHVPPPNIWTGGTLSRMSPSIFLE